MAKDTFQNGVVIEGAGGPRVVFARRQAAGLCCPRCWTWQQPDRAFCWGCGAGFSYRDEQPEPWPMAQNK